LGFRPNFSESRVYLVISSPAKSQKTTTTRFSSHPEGGFRPIFFYPAEPTQGINCNSQPTGKISLPPSYNKVLLPLGRINFSSHRGRIIAPSFQTHHINRHQKQGGKRQNSKTSAQRTHANFSSLAHTSEPSDGHSP